MHVGSGDNTYKWVGNWASVPDTESARTGFAHHGVVFTETGDVITFHQKDSTILVFGDTGNLKPSFEVDLKNAHAMKLVKEGGTEYLWIADNGEKRVHNLGYQVEKGRMGGQVVKMTLGGEVLMSLQRPDLPVYKCGKYSPTMMAVNEERHGGNGDIWVADGYGQDYVHRYDKHGNYISSISGEEGDGKFQCAHGLYIDWRKAEPELYVGEQRGGRVQVYDLDGGFKRTLGKGFLNSSSDFVAIGDNLIVLELRSRLTVLDINDNFVCYLGDNEAAAAIDGWPNMSNEDNQIVPNPLLKRGKFHSPHGIAADRDGNLYITEWLIGGRLTKLVKN